MVTKDDLRRGQVYEAKFQGTNIAPTTIKVRVYFVGALDIYYTLGGSFDVRSTPVERFLEIINK